MKSCFFIGHRETNITILPELIQKVERHITEYGVYDFVVGRHGNIDRLSAIAVRDAKKRHQQVTLTLLHPYAFDIPLLKSEVYDAVFYPPEMERVPKRLAIVRANQYMIEHSTPPDSVCQPSLGRLPYGARSRSGASKARADVRYEFGRVVSLLR